MTGEPRRLDHEPDRAALEELMRAFAPDEPDAEPEIEPDAEPEIELEPTVDVRVIAPDAEPGAGPEPGPDPEPMPEPVPEPAVEPGRESPPGRPRIIRIDDYAGSTEVVDEPAGVTAAAAPPTAVPGPVPPTAATGAPVVISIDDDDLPDALYVQGNLDREGSGPVVFIDDNDVDDFMSVEVDRDQRRGIEPRMRERRVAVRRAEGRRRLRWVLIAVVVVLVVVAALATLGSSLFAVRADQVTVTGNVYTDPDRLEAVVDDLVGTPTLRVDTGAVEGQIEAIPWVDEAKVRTDFPHGASIEISERAAMTTYRGPDGRYRVLDRDGRVLDVLEMHPIAYLLIEGPDPVDLEPGDFAPRGYAAASDLTRILTRSIRGHVERIEVSADGSSLVMFLDDGSEVNFGEARDLFTKLVRLETVLAANPEREPGRIDVSTAETTL